jgi:Ni,Fe-hydrogenase III small subunit
MQGPIRICLIEGAGCGGCALEARSALAARYRAVRRGIIPVEAPAHADVLVLCGPLPGELAEEVQRLGAALPEPWTCLRLGDCCAEETLPGQQPHVPGCPPGPEEILAAVQAAWAARQRAGLGRSEPEAEEQGP